MMLSLACNDTPAANESKPWTGHPVILMGVDGADWSLIQPLVSKGELPNFERLIEGGAWGYLINPGPAVSPAVWTTIATGHFGRRHGILDFVYPYGDGGRQPVNSTLRQEPAIWNIASENGRRVTTVGYYASHPAEEINGAMVTDRAYRGLADASYPESLLADAVTQAKTIKTVERKAILSRFIPWDFDPEDEAYPDRPYAHATAVVSRGIITRILVEEFLARMTRELLPRKHDLVISYFRLVDYVGHHTFRYYDDREFEEKPSARDRAALGGLIPESYRFMDEILGELLAHAGTNANVIVVSDHGFGSGTGHFTPTRPEVSGNHRPDGIFAAIGPDIVPGRYRGMTVMEIMPTVAALLGLPIAETLPGVVEERILAPSFLALNPIRRIPSYSKDEPVPAEEGARTPKSADVAQRETELEMLESLEQLGYIRADTELSDSAVVRGYDFWDASDELVLMHLVGEINYHLLNDDFESAAAVIDDVAIARPALIDRLITNSRTKLAILVEELPADEVSIARAVEFLMEARSRIPIASKLGDARNHARP